MLAIDETDYLFRTAFSGDFFAMLRSWHGLRAHPVRRNWKKLDIILSTSTEPQFFIDRPHESPFNVGVSLPLEDFLPAQVEQLNALRYSPESAAVIAAQVAGERENAAREFDERSMRLRTERDDSLKKLRAAEQQLAAIRADYARLADRLALIVPDIVMPNLVGMQVGPATKLLGKQQLVVGQLRRESAASPAGSTRPVFPRRVASLRPPDDRDADPWHGGT